jgi:ribosomal protein S18 acetylase RimI-like enzyme
MARARAEREDRHEDDERDDQREQGDQRHLHDLMADDYGRGDKLPRVRRVVHELLLDKAHAGDIPTNGRFIFYELERECGWDFAPGKAGMWLVRVAPTSWIGGEERGFARGNLIGFLILHDRDEDGEHESIVHIWTARAHRRSGVASGLLAEARSRFPVRLIEGPATEDGYALIEARAARSSDSAMSTATPTTLPERPPGWHELLGEVGDCLYRAALAERVRLKSTVAGGLVWKRKGTTGEWLEKASIELANFEAELDGRDPGTTRPKATAYAEWADGIAARRSGEIAEQANQIAGRLRVIAERPTQEPRKISARTQRAGKRSPAPQRTAT